MGKNTGKFNYTKIITYFYLTCTFLTLSLSYNNCAQNVQSKANAFKDYDDRVTILTQQFGGKFDKTFCDNSENYACLHKAFSPSHQNEDRGFSNSDCRVMEVGDSGDKRICPQIQSFTYNSSTALESCQENCTDQYEFEEFECHLKLGPVMGVYPLVSSQATLQESLQQLYKSCQQVQEGPQ